MEQQTQECIEQEEMKKNLQQQNKKFVLVDVRSAEEFAAAHIPDTINIPLNELNNRSGRFSREATYITVCGKGGGRSAQAAEILKDKGFNAAWLCGGTATWFNLRVFLL